MSNFTYIDTPSGAYLYDSYPFDVAYSLRKLRSDATACMVVRRASDSTTQEIGFDGDVIDVTSLASFCSGTTCTVDTWYDQGIGGLDLTQATGSSQPRIYTGGAVDAVSGNYAIYFGGSQKMDRTALSILATGNNYSYFTVGAGATTLTFGTMFCTSNVNADRVVHFMDLRATPNRNLFLQNTTPTSYACDMSTARTGTSNRYLTGIVNSSRGMASWDNGATGGTNTYTGTYTNDIFKIGAQHGDLNRLTGYIQEIILYGSDETSNRTGIESNISTYYSI